MTTHFGFTREWSAIPERSLVFFKRKKRARILTFALLSCLVVLFFYFCGSGFIHIPFLDVLKIMFKQTNENQLWHDVVFNIRLPRILGSMMIGGILAGCGILFQAILLNPLASPYTLGISSGAAFGGSLALYLGFQNPVFSAFLWSIVSLMVVILLGGPHKILHPTRLILSGVIVSSIFSAGVSFLKYLFNEEVSSILFWLMGSLVGVTWKDIILLTPFSVVLFVMFSFISDALNILCLGDDQALQLGLNTFLMRVFTLIISSLAIAAAVSVGGVIGFVGLIVPHLFRILISPDHRLLLPISIIGGALLLLLADNIVRAFLQLEIPVGVITTLLGGPFFCFLLIKSEGKKHQ
ncbi:MAG: iron ABC transporter permease [Candidatus Atribacteria bacterium]|nr:iron ABC transporter permease [Candidatus Atribacteria bacterium]